MHHSKSEMSATNIVVMAGETIDFIVDIGSTLNADQFLWAPVIKAEGTKWEARTDFNGPTPRPQYLSPVGAICAGAAPRERICVCGLARNLLSSCQFASKM